MKIKTFTLLLLFIAICFASCDNKQDDVWLSESTGKLSVTHIVNPANYETPTDSAYVDKWVKLYGTNLSSVNSAIYNNEKLRIPQDVVIAGECIQIKIPYMLPSNIDNKLVLSNGNESVNVTLKLGIPPVEVTNTNCEYENIGSTMVINGNYFDLYGIDSKSGKVLFGEIEAPISESSKSEIKVVVPKGVVKNSTMKLIGTNTQLVCPWRYQPTDMMILDFENISAGDTPSGCNINEAVIVEKSNPTYPTNPSIDPLGGSKYLWINYTADGSYNRVTRFSNYSFPSDLETHPQKYALKFEICTISPLQVPIDFELGDYQHTIGKDWTTTALNTKGKWITMSIPLSEWRYGAGNSIGVFYLMINYHGSVAGKVNVTIDNIRIAPMSVEV